MSLTLDLERYQLTGERVQITLDALAKRSARRAATNDRDNNLAPCTQRHGAKEESLWGQAYLEHFTWMLLDDN